MPTQPQLSQDVSQDVNQDGVATRGIETAVAGQTPSTLFVGAERVLPRDPLIVRLPVEMDVAVPIRKFRVRNLLALTAGQLIESQWDQAEDLPLGTRGAQLAWAEFEVLDTKLAVRITRLV